MNAPIPFPGRTYFILAAFFLITQTPAKAQEVVTDQYLTDSVPEGLQSQREKSQQFKTTNFAKRVLAYSSFNADSSKILDSVDFWYSGNRRCYKLASKQYDSYDVNNWHGFTGSDNAWEYDSMKRYRQSNGMLALFSQRNYSYVNDSVIQKSEQRWFNGTTQDFYYSNTYDNSGKLISSVYFQEAASLNNTYLALNIEICHYDLLNRPLFDSVFDYVAMRPSTRYDFSYGMSGDLIEKKTSIWLNNVWSATAREVKTINSQGLLENDSLNYLVNSSWMPADNNVYHYDNNNRLISKVNLRDANLSGSLTHYSLDSFIYQALGTIPASIQHYYWSNGSWSSSGSHIFSLNSNSNFDTIWIYRFDGSLFRREVMTYDADGYLTTRSFFKSGALTPYQKDTYYYDILASVGHLNEKPKIKIYPNPISHSGAGFNISCKNEPLGDVKMLDMSGRLVFRKYFSGTTGHISCHTLVRGSYILVTKYGQEKLLVD